MILNIPHASLDIPPDIRRQFLHSDEELAAEVIRMTDSYTDELFNCQNASSIVFGLTNDAEKRSFQRTHRTKRNIAVLLEREPATLAVSCQHHRRTVCPTAYVHYP